jgi:hypothetical protein
MQQLWHSDETEVLCQTAEALSPGNERNVKVWRGIAV